MNSHFDPNQPRDEVGKWTDMLPGHIRNKVNENIGIKNERVLHDGKDVGLIKTTRLDESTIEIDKLYLNKEDQKKGIGKKVTENIFEMNPGVSHIKVYPLASSEPFWFRFADKVDHEGNVFITRNSFKNALKK